VIHTTYATDPADVLDEAGLQLGEDDTYTTQEGLGMSEITIQRKQMVSIAYGDKTLVVSSYGETVESLLTRMNFNLTTDDAISHAMNAATYDGMVITISRTLSTEEVYTVSVPYNTTYCYDSSLAEGEERVLTQGVEGQIQYTASVLYVDGKEISRTVLSQQVLTQAVDALIAIGACSLEEPHPKFFAATMISPSCTFFTKSISMSSIQCVASSFGSDEFRYLAGMMTSVSTLSPYLNTLPLAAFIGVPPVTVLPGC
jgi:uncharacterized protein YabE (DUF348 family)